MELAKFYYLAHIFISLIGGVLLLSIYYNIRRRFQRILIEDDSQNRVDKGLLYLSMAMFVWVLSGLWGYLGIASNLSSSTFYPLGVNVFSILNNMFILFALFHFQFAPNFIANNEKNVRLILSIIIITALLTFGIPFVFERSLGSLNIAAVPDFLLSAFLSFLLVLTLFKTFVHRGLKVVALISILVVLLILYSQLPEVFLQFGNPFSNDLIKIIAKTSLISIFLVLATTWVIELANTPEIKEMQMKFLDWSLISLNIPSKAIHNEQVDFGSKTTQFKNLLKFAIRRKFGDGQTQGITVGSGAEIKNQSYLTRIIDNINELLNIENEKTLERKDLFTFLGEGKYRLRMLPENIVFKANLLEEFVEGNPDEEYEKLINQSKS